MAPTPERPDEDISATGGDDDVPLAPLSANSRRGQERSAAESMERPITASGIIARLQRELEAALEEQSELREEVTGENLDDWLIGAINDVGRLSTASPGSEDWHFMTSVLPPGLEIVDGEIFEMPGVRLRGLVLEIQAEAHSEIRGDDVLSTAIREERDQLRTRVGVLEEQLQAVSESDDPRILGVMLDQTRYTTMKQQRDAYFQRVQTLEIEVKRLLDYGLGDGGPAEQRMRSERDEIKYSYDKLLHEVNGADGYLAQIKSLESQIATPDTTGDDPFLQVAAAQEELSLEKQRAEVMQKGATNLQKRIDELNAAIMSITTNPKELVQQRDHVSDQIRSLEGRMNDGGKGDSAQTNTKYSGNDLVSGMNTERASKIKDWIRKVQECIHDAPDILKALDDEPPQGTPPATRDERRGVIAWFRGLLDLANNPPLQASARSTPEQLAAEPPPPDKEDDCPQQLAKAREQLAAAIKDANDLQQAVNTLMQQQIRDNDCAEKLEEARNERDAAAQKADDLQTRLRDLTHERMANEACPGQLFRAVARIRDLEAETSALQENIGNSGSRDIDLQTRLAQIQDERDTAIQDATTLRDELSQLAAALTEHDTVVLNANTIRTVLSGQVAEVRGELAATSADRDTAIAERDAALLAAGSQHDEIKRLKRRWTDLLDELESTRNALVASSAAREAAIAERARSLQDTERLRNEIIRLNGILEQRQRNPNSGNEEINRLQTEVDRLRHELGDALRGQQSPSPNDECPERLASAEAERDMAIRAQQVIADSRQEAYTERVNFDPAVVNPHTLPDVVVLQEMLNTRNEGARLDRESLHNSIITVDAAHVALENMTRKLADVRDQRDRLLIGRGGAPIAPMDENADAPRQLEFTRAALERVRQQRDSLLAAASANYSLEVNLPTRYRTLLAAYDIVLEERNRLERVAAQACFPGAGPANRANEGDVAANPDHQPDIMLSEILQDHADFQRERDAARADRTAAEVQRNAALAREARTAEQLQTTTGRLHAAERIIAGNSVTDPRDDLILQLSRRVTELAQQATTARRREVDVVAELHHQRELALSDPLNEDMATVLQDQETRTEQAENARLVVERARLRDIGLARGETDAAVAALSREEGMVAGHEITIASLADLAVRLRGEVIARGGRIVDEFGGVERENYFPERWDEAGQLEQQNLPRLHYNPTHLPQYDIDYPLREDWPPTYQPGEEIIGVLEVPPYVGQELQARTNQIEQLQRVQGNLRRRVVALGGVVVGPMGAVQGENFDEARWNEAGRRQTVGEPMLHYLSIVPDSRLNRRREDWPLAYQPPPESDHNPFRNMRNGPSPLVPGAANSDRGLGIPPPHAPNQRRTVSDRAFSDASSIIDDRIIILPLSPLNIPEPGRSPSPVHPVTPPIIPPVPATPPETPIPVPGPRLPKPPSDPGPSPRAALPTPPSIARPVRGSPPLKSPSIPGSATPPPQTPVKEGTVENDHIDYEPSTTPQGSPPQEDSYEEEEEEGEGEGEEATPKKNPRKPRAIPPATGPPRRSTRLAAIPPPDYTAGDKRKDLDGVGGRRGSRKRRKR